MIKIISLFLISLFFSGSTLVATARYGTAQITEGEMKLLRAGKLLRFQMQAEPVEIFNHDVIRVGSQSKVILNTREKTDLILGSNAVFQVRPWTFRKKRGNLRMLFGRTSIKTRGKLRGRNFRLKTASSAIGIRGTEFFVETTPQGNTSLVTKESVVEIQGLTGETQAVRRGQISVIINGKPATPAVDVPDEVKTSMENEGVDSPGVTSDESSTIMGEEGLVESGVITRKDLDDSKQEQVSPSDIIEVAQNEENQKDTSNDPSQSEKEDKPFEEPPLTLPEAPEIPIEAIENIGTIGKARITFEN